MSTRKVVHEQRFDCSQHELFGLLLRPSAIRDWWSASRVIVLPEVGGTWAATWGENEDEPDYVTVAQIRELAAPSRMVLADYRYASKEGGLPFEADFVTSFEVEAVDGGASLRVTQDGFPADASADAFYAGCQEGWRNTFAGIERHLKGE